jgi:hypothetical protein
VAFRVFALSENAPPAGVLQVAPVADPPINPFNVTLPPLHIVWVAPAVTVGRGFTRNVFETASADHPQTFLAFTLTVKVPGVL